MHFKKKLLLAGLALLTVGPLHAADDDFGIWSSVGVEKKINKKFSVDVGMDFRADQNLESVDRWSGSVGVGYKPWKWLKLGASYIYMYDRSVMETKTNYNKSGRENGYNVDHGYWRSKHRATFDVTAKHKFGRFTVSLRERYLFTHYVGTDCNRTRFRDEVQGGYTGETFVWNGREFMEKDVTTDRKHSKNRHYLRSRLKVEYDIKHCPLTPYAFYELTNNLAEALDLDKSRMSVGVDWKINKRHALSVGYLYERGADYNMDDEGSGNTHVLDIGYKFDF